ncbi:MAG: lycopene cyclase family protein, partial [Myxococcota bacterium]
TDVAVLGGGPAGLGLATELAARGARVACIDPEPESAWDQQFASFLDDWSPAYQRCVHARWAAPSVVTSRRHHVLDRCFALLDNEALHATMMRHAEEGDVQFVADRARDVEHASIRSTVTLSSGERIEARMVVDATGTGHLLDRPAHGPLAAQVGFGKLIEVDRHPFRCGEMALIDYRPIPDGESLPTFLYALPLDFNHLFVEETSLISTVPVSRAMLERRLDARLQRLGIADARVVRTTKTHVPLTRALPSRDQRTLGYGAAASMVHPATGHHIARVLARAPAVAQTLVDQLDKAASLDDASRAVWQAIWPRDDVRKWELYNFGARFLFHLDQDRTERFFDAFFSLPSADWGGFFSASLTSTQLAGVMSRVFARLDPALRWDLMRMSAGSNATVNPLRPALAM